MTARADQLLAQPELTGIRALGGVPGRHAISAVRLVDITEQRVEPGELLVCTTGEISGWRLDALIRRAAATRASGVLVPDDSPGPSAASILIADRLSLPLLASERERLLDHVGQIVRLVAAPDALLGAMILRNVHRWRDGHRSPDEVLADIEAEFGGAARLADNDEAKAYAEDLRIDISVPQTLTRPDHHTLVAYPITLPARQWLLIDLFDPPGVRLEQATTLAKLAALHLRGWFLNRRWLLERDLGHQALVLAALLTERGNLTTATRRQAAELAWRLDGWHLAFHLVPGNRLSEDSTEVVAVALRQAGISAVLVDYRSGWLGWITTDESPGPNSQHNLLIGLRSCVNALGQTRPLRIGVGAAHAGPRGLVRSIDQAQRLTRGMDARTGGVASTDALGISQLVGALLDSPTARVFADAALSSIAEQPALLSTLKTYLDQGGSVTATAAQLDIHRNTVSDRLSRIREAMDLDLNDPDTRLALQLACRTLTLSPNDLR